MRLLVSFLFVLNFATFVVGARLAGECAQMCNDLRTEVLTLSMCREAKRTLPRPKVGDFCSVAMEQGFSDVCVAYCMEQQPVNRVAQTCRHASIEMPRPTVRKWCEHGYNVAFKKTVNDLASHFSQSSSSEPVAEQRSAEELQATESREEEQVHHHSRHIETDAAPASSSGSAHQQQQQQRESGLRGGGSGGSSIEEVDPNRAVLATFPITLDDVTRDLIVYDGQNAEEAVVIFCREHAAEDVSTCIRQLLPVVIEKLEESNAL